MDAGASAEAFLAELEKQMPRSGQESWSNQAPAQAGWDSHTQQYQGGSAPQHHAEQLPQQQQMQPNYQQQQVEYQQHQQNGWGVQGPGQASWVAANQGANADQKVQRSIVEQGQAGKKGENGTGGGQEPFNTPPTPASTPTTGDGSGTGRKRRSRWGPEPEPNQVGQEGAGGRKRKSRWAEDEPKPAIPGLTNVQLPQFIKDLMGNESLDPEVQSLNLELADINRRLAAGQVDDERPIEQRSPSPEPIYDNMGHRMNTREVRAREKLISKRNEVITKLMQKCPNYRPPADYKPEKKYKKLYIPLKEYPGYNFIGLIIGPRGNTQKRMERETGAKIAIRGKGSVKEGRTQQAGRRDFKPDPAENEDLHVLVQADTDDQLERAASMVEKLLVPVDEGRNEHKRTQLRELAALNGTLRDDEYCRLCGEPGHRQFQCPERHSTFRAEGVTCRICGDGGHPTLDCPLKGTPAMTKQMDAEYQSFLEELGGNPEDVGGSSMRGPSGPAGAIAGPPDGGGNWGRPPSADGRPPFREEFGGERRGGSGVREDDGSNLYVGYLPNTIDDSELYRMFEPYGRLEEAKVIKDRMTGQSKGFGFIKYSDGASAQKAVAAMNGFRTEGKSLLVRIASPNGPPERRSGFSDRPPSNSGRPFSGGRPPYSGPGTPPPHFNPQSYGGPPQPAPPPPYGVVSPQGGPPLGQWGQPPPHAGAPVPPGGPPAYGSYAPPPPPYGAGQPGYHYGPYPPMPSPGPPPGQLGYAPPPAGWGYGAVPQAAPAPEVTPSSWPGVEASAPASTTEAPPAAEANVESEYEKFMKEMGR